MTKLSLENDFSELVDNLEVVTLRRANSTEDWKVRYAVRQQIQAEQAEPSNGTVLQADVIWHLQLSDQEIAPQLGDLVIDQQKNRWTILEIQRLDMLGRWKCTTRELRIAYGCHDLVDVDRAVWDDIGSGPEIVSWQPICSALPVKIQPTDMILDSSTAPPTKQFLYQIVLSESVALEPDDRLTAEDGTSYRLQSLQQAERIDVLPVAQVLREESS